MIASASSPRRSFSSFERVGRDHGGQRLIADAQADLSHQAVDPHFVDEAAQPIAAAQGDDEPGGSRGLTLRRARRRRVMREETLDFGFRQAMVTARGLRRPDLPLKIHCFSVE